MNTVKLQQQLPPIDAWLMSLIERYSISFIHMLFLPFFLGYICSFFLFFHFSDTHILARTFVMLRDSGYRTELLLLYLNVNVLFFSYKFPIRIQTIQCRASLSVIYVERHCLEWIQCRSFSIFHILYDDDDAKHIYWNGFLI